MARSPTQKQIAAFIVGHGIVDFVSGGKLSKIERDALWKVIKKLGPPAARGTGSALAATGRTALRAGARVAPVALPAMAAVDAYEMGKRDAAASMAMGGPGYALQNIPNPFFINPTFAESIGVEPSTVDILTPALKIRKRVSRYAKNVGKAMKAVKASTKGGPKGKLSNPRKTFRTVSKTVSRIMKGGKRPRGGITGVISKSIKGTFKKAAKQQKQRQRAYFKGERQYTIR